MQINFSENGKIFFKSFTIILTAIFFMTGLNTNLFAQSNKSLLIHPSWSFNKTIYEVNLRQYSKSGTFKGFEKRLPELKKMGVRVEEEVDKLTIMVYACKSYW